MGPQSDLPLSARGRDGRGVAVARPPDRRAASGSHVFRAPPCPSRHRPSASRALRLGGRLAYERMLSTAPLDQLVRLSDLADVLSPPLLGLRRSSTHVVGIGLHGVPGAPLAETFWTYFPESDCPFYRVSLLSRLSPANVPDPDRQWSLLAEVTEPPGSAPRRADDVVDATVQGLLVTGLVSGRVLVQSRLASAPRSRVSGSHTPGAGRGAGAHPPGARGEGGVQPRPVRRLEVRGVESGPQLRARRRARGPMASRQTRDDPRSPREGQHPPARATIRAHLLRWRPRPPAQRTESTPRRLPSGANKQLDPSRRSNDSRRIN